MQGQAQLLVLIESALPLSAGFVDVTLISGAEKSEPARILGPSRSDVPGPAHEASLPLSVHGCVAAKDKWRTHARDRPFGASKAPVKQDVPQAPGTLATSWIPTTLC